MDDFLKMDIFFVVATFATVVMAVLVAIALGYTIRILRTFDRVSREIEGEAKAIRADLEDARKSIRREGLKLKTFLAPVKKVLKRMNAGS